MTKLKQAIVLNVKLHSVLVYLFIIHKLNFAKNSIRMKIEIGEKIVVFRMINILPLIFLLTHISRYIVLEIEIA